MSEELLKKVGEDMKISCKWGKDNSNLIRGYFKIAGEEFKKAVNNNLKTVKD